MACPSTCASPSASPSTTRASSPRSSARWRRRERMRRLKSLAVVGVGLIGGSFAMALRRAGVVASVVGFDRDGAALERAAELGVIDTAAGSVSEAAESADLVVVAVPVRAIGSVLHGGALAIHAGAGGPEGGTTKGQGGGTPASERRGRFSALVPRH